MKVYRHRFFLGTLIVALGLLSGLAAWHEGALSFFKKTAAPNVRSVVQVSATKNALSALQKTALNAAISRSTASQNQLSEEELTSYPGATLLESAEIAGPGPHQKTHLRLLQTSFRSRSAKSGLIRTEKIVDEQTGAVVGRAEMLADHLLVRLPEEKNPQEFLQSLGAQASAIQRVTPSAPLYNVTLSEGSLAALPQAMETAAANEEVVVEPDFICHAAGSNVPTYFPALFFLHHQWGLWEDCGGINVEQAWHVQSGAPSVIVAVFDSGIRDTHEDLAANIWTNPNLASDQADYPDQLVTAHGIDVIDTDVSLISEGHGTHCAGIIGGMGIHEGAAFGVVPQVQLMDCHFLDATGHGDTSTFITCCDYAVTHGATILNCSFTFDPFFYGFFFYPEDLFQAVQRAQAAGVLVVAAAGNADVSTDAWGNQKLTPHNNDMHPFFPANLQLDNVISVAASNFSWLSICQLSLDSNYGPNTVHLAAPGVNIFSTWGSSDDAYACLSGSSMATAFVSGSLALLKAHYPHASYQSLRNHLFNTADNALQLQGKVLHGHLNVGRALQMPLENE